jgi:hypothetical protein
VNWSSEDIRRAIDGLRAKLARKEDLGLQEAFDAGLHPNLLAYGKLGECMPSVPIIDKYLIGATSFLHQPSNYYDIFRACRCVNIIHVLDAALVTLLKKGVAGLGSRMERLARETEHDRLDAVVFELLTAARYAEQPAVQHVEFIEQDPAKKTPDFLIRAGGVESAVECKKVDRAQNFTVLIRNAVRDDLNAVIASFRGRRVSALADVVYNCDPQKVERGKLVAACNEALDKRTRIIEPDFNVTAVPLKPWESKTYTLYPSAFFQWHRYGYRIRSEWFGIVNQMIGSMARRANLPARLRGGVSAWLNEIDWDAAVKWRVSSEEVVAKYRRFAFDGVFKAIEQLKGCGPNSTVHLWLESEYSVGGRRATLVDLLGRIGAKAQDIFGWILVNETLFDISPKGHFDMIEHAHFIRGPSATTKEPRVYSVFTPDETGEDGAQFGVGKELPDIDAE